MTPDPKPTLDPQQLAMLEEDLLEKVEKKAEIKQLVAQADAELAEAERSPGGTIITEQVFLMMSAAIMIVALPFIHYLLAIILTAFTIVIALVAGFSSPKESFSPRVNLFVSLVGLILFEYSAIFTHTALGADNSFWLYQTLAFLFLFSTFFSARTYRKKLWRE